MFVRMLRSCVYISLLVLRTNEVQLCTKSLGRGHARGGHAWWRTSHAGGRHPRWCHARCHARHHAWGRHARWCHAGRRHSRRGHAGGHHARGRHARWGSHDGSACHLRAGKHCAWCRAAHAPRWSCQPCGRRSWGRCSDGQATPSSPAHAWPCLGHLLHDLLCGGWALDLHRHHLLATQQHQAQHAPLLALRRKTCMQI